MAPKKIVFKLIITTLENTISSEGQERSEHDRQANQNSRFSMSKVANQ